MVRPRGAFLALLALLGAACHKEPGSGYVAGAGPVPRPAGPLGAEEAARYVLQLVNHDRAKEGLPPVEWDDTAALHVDDMTRNGFTAHWGTDGSVPEQRYTESGGRHLVWENAACLFDGQVRELDPSPTFDPVDMEKIETAFISEVPPNDGHRQNILKKWHVKLGVAVAKPAGVKQPCMAQEFVDEYGEYEDLPREAKPGQVVRVAGEVREPVKFGAIGVARTDLGKPMTVPELLQTSGYAMPKPFVLYTPPGFQTPKPVQVDGARFTIDVPLSEAARPGRYSVSVWARYPGDDALTMVSLRTVRVQ
jgi:uncharacterized protein YkwD